MVRCTTSLGMRPPYDTSITVSDLCGAWRERAGREWGAGEGGGAQPCKKHQFIKLMNKYCSAVHGVRLPLDLEETGQPREDQITCILS